MSKISRLIRYAMLRLNVMKFITLGRYSDVPERNILTGYLVYLLIGFVLLMSPWSTTRPVAWEDNLFTAASAISTTGLATVDIGQCYTLFGQIVVMLLVQLGGIGYMTLSSYIIYRLTHHAAGPSTRVVSTSIQVPYGMNLSDLVSNVIHFTIIFEVLGFVAFYFALNAEGVAEAGWHAAFLSVSSFCTAGFTLFPDNLVAFADNMAINAIVAVLSYTGAMGFIVITDIKNHLRHRSYPISFTTKVIVLITAIMTVGGTLTLAFSPDLTGDRGVGHSLILGFFQTMSAMTTVGFNTMDLSGIPVGPALILMLVMFVGASPSGTGGGVKSTSVSAVWGFIVAKLGLRERVTFLGKSIPSYRVDSALTNVIAYGAMIFAGSLVLAYTEPFALSRILFEATSAMGTVGLSTGITPDLSMAGKMVLVVLMYVGRVGVITFGSALVIRAKGRKRSAPSADLVA